MKLHVLLLVTVLLPVGASASQLRLAPRSLVARNSARTRGDPYAEAHERGDEQTLYTLCHRSLQSAWEYYHEDGCEGRMHQAADEVEAHLEVCSTVIPSYRRSYEELMNEVCTWCGGYACHRHAPARRFPKTSSAGAGAGGGGGSGAGDASPAGQNSTVSEGKAPCMLDEKDCDPMPCVVCVRRGDHWCLKDGECTAGEPTSSQCPNSVKDVEQFVAHEREDPCHQGYPKCAKIAVNAATVANDHKKGEKGLCTDEGRKAFSDLEENLPECKSFFITGARLDIGYLQINRDYVEVYKEADDLNNCK